MNVISSSLLNRLSVVLFISTLMVPMVCALTSVEDSMMLLSSLAEEEEGETKDAKEDTEAKIATILEGDQSEDAIACSFLSFSYFRFNMTPYLKIVIPPPQSYVIYS